MKRNLKLLRSVFLPLILTFSGFPMALPSPAQSQGCNYYTGTSSSGQPINIDRCSIARTSDRSVNFAYTLGSERMYAQANCESRSWMTFPERTRHFPQSRATQNMLQIACTAPTFNDGIWIGIVFDPPSYVRNRPDGSVVCTIQGVRAIELYGGVTGGGNWYRTSACGGGVIHKSQVR
jgi:hypothetical protein